VRIIQFRSGQVTGKAAGGGTTGGERGEIGLDRSLVEALRRRARRNTRSSRLNNRIAALAYIVVAVTMIVAIETRSSGIVAIIALPGLAAIWLYGSHQARTSEDRALQDLVSEYRELMDLQANTPFEAETVESRPVESKPVEAFPPRTASPLSDRETEVLIRIAGGDSNKQAALALSISEQTVKNHLKHVYTKLSVNDRTSAILTAIGNGWIGKSRGKPKGDWGPDAL
jgi:DNA-binding CsgD family transcriptional regulator